MRCAPRRLDPRSIHPERARGRWKIQARGRDTLVIGRSDIDLRAVDIEDTSQVRAIGWILGRLSEWREPAIDPAEIVRDMGRTEPMNRLLQGDVGSGKTLVALMGMLIALDNGYRDPVGLAIGSRTPAEIAVAIAAALIQQRNTLTLTAVPDAPAIHA